MRCYLYGALLLCAVSAQADSPAWSYGDRGLEWRDDSAGSFLWLGLRAQSRYSSAAEELHAPEDFDAPDQAFGTINRSRFKVGAQWRDRLTGYHEYNLRDGYLLDLRATYQFSDALNLRLGQWKTEYNRERIDSSGNQQLVDRSIATYWFTLDRQWGLMASGRVAAGSVYDSSWWAGVLAGNGRGEDSDGGRPLLMTRWQWNYTGDKLPFSQSDLARRQPPQGSLSFSAAVNDSQYTRFSGSGGSQLPGYETSVDNRYRITQVMQEWAWQGGGWSWQQELHVKQVRDRTGALAKRTLWGGYLQGGWFPGTRWQRLPQNVEVAMRAAYVDPDQASSDKELELTAAANVFFNGHRNKLSFEVSRLELVRGDNDSGQTRFRVQWDWSI